MLCIAQRSPSKPTGRCIPVHSSEPPPTNSRQANKNVMVKARAGLDGFSVAAVVRSWWQPAFTCALAAAYDLRTGQTRLGATAAIESFHHLRCSQFRARLGCPGLRRMRASSHAQQHCTCKIPAPQCPPFAHSPLASPPPPPRYERSPEGNKMAGARLTQRHVASAEDEAYHKGKGILVPLSEVDNPDVRGVAAGGCWGLWRARNGGSGAELRPL